MGLHRAWPDADITGIDIALQPRYPFRFVQGDVMHYLDGALRGFDFIWASPPCQAHSRLNGINGKEYRDYIAPVRERLQTIGLAEGMPFVIENVIGAPLRNPITLCGSMFNLGVWRHRIFEIHRRVVTAPVCRHADCPEPLDVTGTGGPCATRTTKGGGLHRKPKNMAQASIAMGIDWMIRRELTQAIPPAYSFYIAQQLRAVL